MQDEGAAQQGSQLLRWLMQIEEADVGIAGNLGYILFGWLGLAAPNGAQFIGEASAARQHDDGSPLARVGKHFSARNEPHQPPTPRMELER